MILRTHLNWYNAGRKVKTNTKLRRYDETGAALFSYQQTTPMTYFDDYILYASVNEASPRFHKWACLVTLANAITRKVWINQGDWRVYPNVYVGFVGEPASGKSIALSFASKLAQKIDDAMICPASITKEALTQYMSKECKKEYLFEGKQIFYSPISIFSNELVTLLGKEPTHMIDFLTDVYDQDYHKAYTKHQGRDEIYGPCVNLLCCVTPTTLQSMVVEKLVKGGFTRRLIPVYAKERGAPNAFPEFTSTHEEARNRCAGYANKLSKLNGPFDWTPEAKSWFKNWYDTVKDPAMRAEKNPVMQGYLAAKDNLLLKVAMLLSLSKSPELVLHIESVQEAERWLVECEADILNIFGGGGRNQLASVKLMIERFIKDGGKQGQPEAFVKRYHYHMADDKEISAVLEHLVTIGSIVRLGEAIQQGHSVVQVHHYVHRDHTD